MPERKKHQKIGYASGQQRFILMTLLAEPLNKEGIVDKFNALSTQFGAPPWHKESEEYQKFLDRLDVYIQNLAEMGLILEREGVYHLTQEGQAEASKMRARMLKAGLKVKQFFSSGKAASKFSVFINALLSALKLGVGLLVNSMGLIADGLDNLTDVLSSVVVFLGIKYKREIYSTAFIILVMFIVGASIGYGAISRLIHPQPVEAGLWAILAAVVSGIVCYLMSMYQHFVGKRSGSLSLISQSIDSKNHTFVAVAVLTGIICARFGILIVDSLVGIVVAFLILKSAVELAPETFKVAKGGELDFSKFKRGYEQKFEQHRMNYFKFWVLFELKNTMTKEELVSKFRTTFSVPEIPVAREFDFSFGRGFEFEKHLDPFLDEMVVEGAIVEEQERYSITESGIGKLNKRLKHQRHR